MPAPSTDQPSSRQLARATLLAIAVAALVLVTIVLPAEYGLDPTGAGRALGLFRPPADASASGALPESAAVSSGSLLKSPAPFRTDELTVTLSPGEGAEIKAAMRQGERIVFSWTSTGGGVDVDMHSEFTGAREGDATSYWTDEFQTSGHGAFEAPAAGNHGWFWQNLNDDPVTVTVKVSGFYEKLFRP